jgi:hypothetical protein
MGKKEYFKLYQKEHKEQISARGKQYYLNNKEYFKQYQIEHKYKILAQKKQYYIEHKEQISARQKQYIIEHKEQMKQYQIEHKEQMKQYQKQYREDNKEKIKQYKKQYHEDNKKQISAQQKQYKKEHKEQTNQYQKQRLQTDPMFKLIRNCRNRVRIALKTNKSKSTLEYIKCSIDFLHQHIQNQFDSEMTWDNMGTYWELDHIFPIMYDNPSDEDIIFRLGWYNLQPLKKELNRCKLNNAPSIAEKIKFTNNLIKYNEMFFK